MRHLSILIIVFFCFSCLESMSGNCFIESDEESLFKEEKPLTVQQILQNKSDCPAVIWRLTDRLRKVILGGSTISESRIRK